MGGHPAGAGAAPPHALSAHTLGDVLARSAARTPGKLAIVYRDLRQTFAELDETVNRTANALTRRGARKGERLALLSHNNHAFVVLQYAAARLGVILVPINFMLQAAEVAYILRHSGAVGMVVEDALVPVAEAALASEGVGTMRILAVIEETGARTDARWEPVSRWLADADASRPQVDIGYEDPVHLMYTSGTESRPKGATLSHRNLLSQFVSCIVDGEMTADDVEVHSLPLFHCAQLHCFVNPDIYLGATSILLAAPDAATLLAMIQLHRATKLFCPPTIWIALLRHPNFDKTDLSTLRKGYYGASIMPVEVIKELSQRLPKVRLFNFYGQTEMSPVATVLKPDDQLRKLGSAGRPCLNVQTRVVDEYDEPVAPGVVGEIVHRGPHVMLGYWEDPEKTADVFRNGWFHSGDLGVLDDEGYLSVVDRKKDMIKTGGENVASREVEEVIYQHPKVAEVAVFGVPHPRWIEAVTAVVVVRQGQTLVEAELQEFCRAHLAGFKTPKYYVFTEALPKNASGKILKRDLRQHHLDIAKAPA